jgi:hypothetical protein
MSLAAVRYLESGGPAAGSSGARSTCRAAAALEPAGELDAGETGGNMSEEQTLRHVVTDPEPTSGFIMRDDEYSDDDYDVADDEDDLDEDDDDEDDDDEDFEDDDEEEDLDEEDEDEDDEDDEDLADDDEDFDEDDEEDEDDTDEEE